MIVYCKQNYGKNIVDYCSLSDFLKLGTCDKFSLNI